MKTAVMLPAWVAGVVLAFAAHHPDLAITILLGMACQHLLKAPSWIKNWQAQIGIVIICAAGFVATRYLMHEAIPRDPNELLAAFASWWLQASGAASNSGAQGAVAATNSIPAALPPAPPPAAQ